jgi:hypothetical protein
MKHFENFSKDNLKMFKRLNSPAKIQDFVNSLKMNFEDTCQSPKMVLASGKAQCVEGALLAATILRFHGYEPLIVDLESTAKDSDHVIAVFKKNGFWGAISKTNHAVLRYREPVYKSIRELCMSYFHEYFMDDGKKTLRTYSKPVNLKRFDSIYWMISNEEVWEIPNYLTEIPHTKILNKKQISNLRKADKIEIEAGKLVEWKK